MHGLTEMSGLGTGLVLTHLQVLQVDHSSN